MWCRGGVQGLLSLLVLSGVAVADEPVTIRMATSAPDGTAWAREMKGYAREVEAVTEGAVRVKWYLGGIAGDEFAVMERIQRGQLDGAAGTVTCEQMSPSMRVLRLPGLYRSRDEWGWVMQRLRPLFSREFADSGYIDLGVTGLGPTVIFSRKPVRSLADLRRIRVWTWDVDGIKRLTSPVLGLQATVLPVQEAAHAYDAELVDGITGAVAAALAFQWSARAKYVTPLKLDYLPGCVVIAKRTVERLSFEHQQAVRAISGKYLMHIDESSRQMDDALLGGLFAKQGVQMVPVTPSFQKEWNDVAAAALRQLGDKLVPAALLQQTQDLLREYRAKHFTAAN